MHRVLLEKKVLNENDRIAASLRQYFTESGTLCLNLISSPGSGKTTLLETTLASFSSERRVAVLTGDIQTENDAVRLQRFGFPVKQITTAGTCHLTASMIERHLADWRIQPIELLFIENVGNLVCPASYDLGEAAKIVLLSVTEGEDKPLKYPSIFFKSELAVLTKTDLLPYVAFSVPAAEQNLRRVHPGIELLTLSCTSGQGIEDWFEWLRKRSAKAEALCGA